MRVPNGEIARPRGKRSTRHLLQRLRVSGILQKNSFAVEPGVSLEKIKFSNGIRNVVFRILLYYNIVFSVCTTKKRTYYHVYIERNRVTAVKFINLVLRENHRIYINIIIRRAEHNITLL